MKYFKTFVFLLFLLLGFDNCVPDENDVGHADNNFYKKTSEKFYSPDKRCYATIVEHGLDSTEANTQVLLTFDRTGAGIYFVYGIHKDLKVNWADNSTIIIETKEEYKSSQKSSEVKSFSDKIKINYIYK